MNTQEGQEFLFTISANELFKSGNERRRRDGRPEPELNLAGLELVHLVSCKVAQKYYKQL
jgi:hypothetical protein